MERQINLIMSVSKTKCFIDIPMIHFKLDPGGFKHIFSCIFNEYLSLMNFSKKRLLGKNIIV